MANRINTSLYENAPEMILNKLAEINEILAKQKAKTGETDSYKFWSQVGEVMLFAWQYMKDLEFILKQNNLLKQENNYLHDYVERLEKRLIPYETIRQMKLDGSFEEVTKVIDALINSGYKEIRIQNKTIDNANGD